MVNFNFSEKVLGLIYPPYFMYDFSRKMFHVTFYQLARFRCFIPFTSGDIGQYAYYNCLLIGQWRHKI